MPLAHRSRTTARPHRALAALAAVGVAAAGLLALPGPAAATTPVPSPVVDSANGRGNVIANLFQWTWDSVAAECTSTLGPAGYGWVQVSPPQEHVRGTAWWTSYQPVSYRIESKLGTRAEFAAMVDTCRDAGVGVVVDAVVNHTTGADQGSGTGSRAARSASTRSPASTRGRLQRLPHQHHELLRPLPGAELPPAVPAGPAHRVGVRPRPDRGVHERPHRPRGRGLPHRRGEARPGGRPGGDPGPAVGPGRLLGARGHRRGR